MRSFGVTAKRLQHAPNLIEEHFSHFVSWIRNRLAQLIVGVQSDAVTLADFSSVPYHYLAFGLTAELTRRHVVQRNGGQVQLIDTHEAPPKKVVRYSYH